MNFYVMYGEQCVEDYAMPGEAIKQLEDGCLNSEFQYLDHKPIQVEISDDGGLNFPDFIICDYIPLISHKFYNILIDKQINNLFYKPVALTFSPMGRKEQYYLALPPRINCLDQTKSEIQCEAEMKEVTDIVINPTTVGNYKIFKLAGVVNQEIIVTEDLKQVLEQADLENVYFYKIKGV